jgi:hypothetical protein
MATPTANVRRIDRHRAIRATLGFIRGDSLAIHDVIQETDADPTPQAVTALILAVTEQAATMIGAQPGGEEMLAQMLLEYAQEQEG